MRIVEYGLEAIEEPIKAPFAFKGRSSDRPMWNTAVRLVGARGHSAIGLSNQGILWSDEAVHGAFSYVGGNALMYLMSEFAGKRAKEMDFETPSGLLRALLPEVLDYGRQISGMKNMKETFALNALVALDTAAWLLYARERGLESFDEMIPCNARAAMAARHDRIAAIPLIGYAAGLSDIESLVDAGSFCLKIKIGANPEGDDDRQKMLEHDKLRLSQIHALLKDRHCAHTDNGHILYYLDANGRYDSKERLLRLLEHADQIGALDRIVLLEEPFAQTFEADVSDIPVRMAADESAHTDRDVRDRIEMGYRAIALKPIAKTVSMTFDMLTVCARQGIPCFCADLTVNAWMADLNKNFAARLPVVPGLRVGLLESNGHQYYSRWGQMCEALPYPDATWVHPEAGLYHLDASFYEKSGGCLAESPLYKQIFV